MKQPTISAGLTVNPRTQPLLNGLVELQGADLSITAFRGGSELFWRQLKFGDFDLTEMSLSTLMILANKARLEGVESNFVGLPIFTSRMYFHLGVMVRRDRGIETPADLHDKLVGVPEYQQTAAVWTRGVLADDFGFDPTKVHWYMERVPEISHAGVTGYEPPRGVELNWIPRGESIGSRLMDGSLDATLRYLPNRNLVDRSRVNLDDSTLIRPMFDSEIEAQRYHDAHQLFPINHGIAIKRSVVEKYPWLVLNTFHAFSEARDQVDSAARAHLSDFTKAGIVDADLAKLIGKGRFPYGVRANSRELETLCRYAHEQGMTSTLLTPEDIFDERTLDL